MSAAKKDQIVFGAQAKADAALRIAHSERPGLTADYSA